MRIFYSGLPKSIEGSPELLIREHNPDVMSSFCDFFKGDRVKVGKRFRKHLRNLKSHAKSNQS